MTQISNTQRFNTVSNLTKLINESSDLKEVNKKQKNLSTLSKRIGRLISEFENKHKCNIKVEHNVANRNAIREHEIKIELKK